MDETGKFRSGVHSPASWAKELLEPLFKHGTISEYPGAEYYAICYGELCAYGPEVDKRPVLLAIWSTCVPDVPRDVVRGKDYAGTWLPYNTKTGLRDG